MIKVTVIVGSNRKGSNTEFACRELIQTMESLANYSLDIEFKLLSKCYMEFCVGCNNCFLTGKCTLNDDIETIKLDMLNSDIIIWATPVYCFNVTGVMKNFIDRVTYWTHLFGLAGKYSVIVTTTSQSGSIYVCEYLKSILQYMGSTILGYCNFCVDQPNELFDEKLRNDILKTNVEKILKNMEIGHQVTPIQEIIFQNIKKGMDNQVNKSSKTSLMNAEAQYWKSTGLLTSSTYRDYLITKNLMR